VSHILGYDSKESPFLPVLSPRHSSNGNVDPILGEAATGELPVIEPQNIEVGLFANHGKESGKLIHIIDSRSSKMVEEVGCIRITDDVDYKNINPETNLRGNPDIDYTRRAPESPKEYEHIFLSKPISSQRKFIRKSSGTGDDSRSDSVCPESVEFNEAGSWYGVSCFGKQNSDAAWNTEFANTDRNEVIGMSQWMESSGRHAVEHRKS